MNPRRLFTLALAAALAGQAAPLRAQASSASPRRVGVLAPSTREKEEIILKPFFDQMRELGWEEGQNIIYDRAYADDQLELLPRLALELVARMPEVIYAPPQPAAMAAKQATQTIPIVFGVGVDPVGSGLVASLPRPGGNVTGIISFNDALTPKRVQLLREILPGARRIGLLGDSIDSSARFGQKALEPLAASLGLTVILAEVPSPVDFDTAVGKLLADRVDAIFQVGSAFIVFNLTGRLIELANQGRVPVVGARAQVADAGALFSFGASRADQLRRSALLVDKILKGAKPADLPVEQATLFEFVVNLKAAKALGIIIPRSILLRADRAIE